MANPHQVFPEPLALKLKRICLAQAIVSVSALTSMAVLLLKVLPPLMNEFN